MRLMTLVVWLAFCGAVFGLLGCGSGDSGAGADASADTDTDSDDPRDALREASLFDNISFEATEADGVTPTGWTCVCWDESQNGVPVPCETTTADSAHGARALLVPAGCGAYQDETEFDDTLTVRFDLFARGEGIQPSWMYLVNYDAADSYREVAEGTQLAGPPGAWRNARSELLPMAERVRVRMVLLNNGSSDLVVDDLVAVQDGQSPPPVAGSLLRAEHYTELAYAQSEVDGGEAGEIWLPLPLDHATQVPLYVELTATPESVIDSVEYVTEDEDNWGAVIRLTQDGAADPVAIHWLGVVLAREVTDAERPAYHAQDGDPAAWLAATPVVDAAYPGIADTAAMLASTEDPALDRMQAVIEWTSANIVAGSGGQDATTVFNTQSGVCTGFANLAAALGRALDVPTRTVANYLVGGSQQTHYIDEFWLGEELGWRRVEPQGTSPSIREGYGVIVRLDATSDETDQALGWGSRWGASGVPLNSLVEPRAGYDRMSCNAAETNYFEDCPYCDNRAELRVQWFEEEAASMDDVFDRARALWQVDLAEYVAGGLSEERMAIRRQALDAATLADVDAMLTELE